MNEPRGIQFLREKLKRRNNLTVKDGLEVDAILDVCCKENLDCECWQECVKLNDELSDYLPPYLTAAPEAQKKGDPGLWLRATIHGLEIDKRMLKY